ncbi:MAG: hypothetical protein ACE5LA_03630 [Dehalococcoidales bacterium]
MSIERALGMWAGEGKPVIHLGPGENCFDLERLLEHPWVNLRYLTTVRGVLFRRESCAADVADQMVKLLDGRTQDVCDAVRLARLALTLGVEKAIELLLPRGEGVWEGGAGTA